MNGFDLRVRFTWTDHGPVILDERAHLIVATLPAMPGLYRWSLTGRPGRSVSVARPARGSWRRAGPAATTETASRQARTKWFTGCVRPAQRRS